VLKEPHFNATDKLHTLNVVMRAHLIICEPAALKTEHAWYLAIKSHMHTNYYEGLQVEPMLLLSTFSHKLAVMTYVSKN
jgi:hypothetical protein